MESGEKETRERRISRIPDPATSAQKKQKRKNSQETIASSLAVACKAWLLAGRGLRQQAFQAHGGPINVSAFCRI
jgi:hypothetical protein